MNPDQNLLRPDEVARRAEIPVAPVRRHEPGYAFGVVLDILSVAAAGGFGFAYFKYLGDGLSGWFVVGLMLAFGLFVGLQALLQSDGRRRFWIMLAQVIAASILFIFFDITFLVVAILLLALFFWWGYAEARRDLSYTTEIRFFANTKGVFGKFITGVLLFMILLYVPKLTPQRAFVSEKTFSGFFNATADVIQQWYPALPLSGSFGDLADQIAAHALQSNPQFQMLSPQLQSTTVSSNAQALIDSFSKNLGRPVQATDTIAGVLYGGILQTLSGWQNKFASIFLIGWTAVVFLILRSIGIVFMWIDQVLLAIVYETLLAAKVIIIREEPTTKETIEYV